jgi:hypothetical protein
VLSRLPRNAPAWLDRLSAWLGPFEVCFTHVAQRGAFRRYLLGLLSDSRRKSMSAMLERVSDPGTYQAFQHFITDAPADAVITEILTAHFFVTRPHYLRTMQNSRKSTCESNKVVTRLEVHPSPVSIGHQVHWRVTRAIGDVTKSYPNFFR